MFGFDYLHGIGGVETEDDTPIKILVAKCNMTKYIFAHVVPQEGMDPEHDAVEKLKRDTLWLGHTKVILKSDNEQAIVALLRNALKALSRSKALKKHIQQLMTRRPMDPLKWPAGRSLDWWPP